MHSRQHGSPRLAALALWLLPCMALPAELNVEVTGLEEQLLSNVRANLQMQDYVGRDVSPAQVRMLYGKAEEQIRQALRPFGYYHAQVESDLQQTPGGGFRATFEVHPGAPVIVRDVHVEVQGPAAEMPEVRAALKSFQPQEGERLRHAAYENSKAAVSAELRSTGFLDAELVRHRVAVTRATNSAEIDLVWESGERYRFGRVRFTESQFSDGFLRGYVPWEPGDYYSAEEVLSLQERLVGTDYFSVVSVQPELEKAQNRKVPVEVLLRPDERTVYTAGVYVSTDTGPGGRLGLERRWLNSRGHKAEAELEYSQLFQQASVNYRIPRPGPFNRNYTIGAAYVDEQTDDIRSRTTSVAAAEARERWHGFNRTLGLQYVDSDFEIAGERQAAALFYGEGVLTRRVADDVLFPLKGYAVTLGLRASPGTLLSDTRLLQFHAQGKWIRSLGPDGRILLRGELGAMAVGDFNDLPPRLRFFAGGDRSVRGFDYQDIGEVNAAGGVIGGKYLSVASVEYEHYFLQDWGAAVFVDVGDAFISDFDVHTGTGIGVRWKSPVGTVRLDFARPVAGDLGEGWRIHLVIGPDL